MRNERLGKICNGLRRVCLYSWILWNAFWRRSLKFSLIAFALAAVFDLIFWATGFEGVLERLSEEFINVTGRYARSGFRPDVIVLDSSDIGQVNNGLNDKTVTDRQPLKDAIKYLTATDPKTGQARVKSIGIDWDFSPDPLTGGYLSADDPDFLHSLKDLRAHSSAPVFVGVYRQAASGAAKWLGNKDLQGLAGAILGDDREPMWATTLVSGHGDLPSLAVRLAPLPQETKSSPWALVESHKILRVGQTGFMVANNPIDTTYVWPIRQHVLSVYEVSKSPSVFPNKIVLIGHAKLGKATDVVFVPGVGQVPGVILQACAVQTFLSGGKKELTLLGSKLGEFGIAVLCPLILFLRSRKYGRKNGVIFTADARAVLWWACFIVAIALIAALWTQILWTGYLSVTVGLVISSRIELVSHQLKHRKHR